MERAGAIMLHDAHISESRYGAPGFVAIEREDFG